jgi:uncharacterized protein YdhG (YjbR/CyaY superfamily)
MQTIKAISVDEYIEGFPKKTQVLLKQLRKAIIKAAPKAVEQISYGMPAYKYLGVLVYFAGYQNHIGFYGTPAGHQKFKKELSIYKTGKGSVQFPLEQPLPLDLITAIIKFRVQENEAKNRAKQKPLK